MPLATRLSHYEKLMRLDRPVGILLLLWPALWALWLASRGQPDLVLVWIFVLGAALMRSAGCVVNDIADRNFDRHVARTRDRPITAGLVGVKEALVLAAVLTVLAGSLVLMLNWLTIAMSLLALMFAFTYPFTKRFFAVPQAYLGIAFGFGVPMAYAAATGGVPLVAWVMMLANVFWAIAYDTAYAMVDREDDLKIGIKTSAITFGRFDLVGIAVAHGAFLLTMIAVGVMTGRGGVYFGALVLCALLARYQVALCATREPQQCFKAFMNNIAVGGVVFVGILMDGWFRVAL
ncbi:MAG: 4-hydroxybenzoate octaprenyltransferase [Rhodocyclaceae bacterium]|nr:4-hydroxybenzoate octaprenyltransferase [Rhodocyclaceae bacterium]MCA3105279.1 4-hydroxybenzoate octaprenyltransferase [Rhodocyclaceae bacterium]MCA3117680.1 4-hydroxybenzoate octaprenyltransferase [Rhodocyclaceae bacterium]MCA3126540.1 4-hydroxybenzoate octaprenyltransferase [Rhodocyclaceae bacterium]MCA3137644.1 4-hydroxybenzoate octaprenyltransferase [Rhodocyclaceae bacterium]